MSDNEKRVTVIMPQEMADWLEEKAKRTGVGTISAVLRMMIRQAMDEDAARAAGNEA